MGKVGRPTVFVRDWGGDSAAMAAIFQPSGTYETKRSVSNAYYVAEGMGIIKEAASEIEHSKLFVDKERQRIHCNGVLEQLGRMLRQDGYSRENVIYIANAAANARHEGYTSKAIERYISNGRKTGEW